MGQQIIEAILENGQIIHVSKKLPRGKLKVKLVYDSKKIPNRDNLEEAITETSGIYKDITVDVESRALRSGWDRNM